LSKNFSLIGNLFHVLEQIISETVYKIQQLKMVIVTNEQQQISTISYNYWHQNDRTSKYFLGLKKKPDKTHRTFKSSGFQVQHVHCLFTYIHVYKKDVKQQIITNFIISWIQISKYM
jgi:hypothetical protein